MSTHLSVAGRTEVGRERKHNEDSLVVADLTGGNLLDPEQPVGRFEIGERGVLLAVSDGMGGHKAGEVASALVVESLTRTLAKAPPSVAGEQVKIAVQTANRVVRNAAMAPGNEGMGATLTALCVQGETAYVAEVGDSRAYLVRAGAITQLTHDQSYVQVLLDTGAILPEEAERSPLRNVLAQAMGHEVAVSIELGRLELRDRDCFVLCSDGLTKYVSDEEIRSRVLSSPRLEVACTRLVDLAGERGGADDTTVILAGVSGALPPCSVGEGVQGTFEILESFQPRTLR
jgi:serine/threonine protein phosphatase PrpC